MFNYVSIEFPLAQKPPQRISYMMFNQRRYAHEIATVKFRDWDVRYSDIKPGEPVRFLLRGEKASREFVGYIHDIRPDISPGKQFVEVTFIGASYRLKQAKQRVFSNVTASDVARAVAKEHGFSQFVEDHPRVYQQIAQAGHTDLELLTRLAKQCGYTFRIENTSLYFQPMTQRYTSDRVNAPTFIMREANDPRGSTLYSFKLMLGESMPFKDAYKSAPQVGGVDAVNAVPNIVTNKRRPEVTRDLSNVEFFDSFATDVVAPSLATAAHEAYALDQRNRFPYRAEIEVLGTPSVAPDTPVYLAGVGAPYSGYWIVLSTQHLVTEESPNILKYTTKIEVGTDSLGSATVWSDGKLVDTPEVIQTRNIVPNTRNKIIDNTSVLTNGSTAYSNSGFSQAKNRVNPTSADTPWLWQAAPTANPDATQNISQPTKTAVTVDRLEALGVR